jgi:hypothetical protein
VVKNNGSTKSLNNMLSSLKVYSLQQNHSWLDASDAYQLKKIKEALEFHDSSSSRQMLPFTQQILQQLVPHFDLEDEVEYLKLMMMWLAHDSLMRSGELLSGLKCKDLAWDNMDQSVTITLWRSKANRRGAAEIIRLVDYEGISAYKLLSTWFDNFNLCLQLFPKPMKNNSLNFDEVPSPRWWSGVIRQAVSRIGLQPAQYSGHSFRAGGATDLFTARVPYNIIKKMGRWKTDSALKYYRDEVDVAVTVAEAFGRGNKRGKGLDGEK